MDGAKNMIAHLNLARGFRGGERQTLLLLRELSQSGWQQRLVVRRGSELGERAQGIDGIKVVESANVVSAALKLKGASLSHAHDGRSIQASALAWRLAGVPYVVTRRVMNALSDSLPTRWMYRRAGAVVAISSAVASELERYDSLLKIQKIADAYDDTESDERCATDIRSRYGSGVVVGNVAALEIASKGQPSLLAAASALPELRFVLVGSGKDEAQLRQLATGLDNVFFEGQVTDVASFLAAFDVFAFPSLREGFGSVLLDAMRAGLPLVAFASGGIPDIVVDGSGGYLLEPGDDNGFQRALRKLADDPVLRTRFGEFNRNHVTRFAPSIMAGHYQALYNAVLTGA